MANEYGMLGLGAADRMDQEAQLARRNSAMEYARLTPSQQNAFLANNAAQMVGEGVGGMARAGVGYFTGTDTRGTADKVRGVQAQIAQALQNVNPEDIDAVYPKLIGIFQQNGMIPEAMQAAEKYESLKNARETKSISRAEHERKVALDAQNERIAKARLEVGKKGSPTMQLIDTVTDLQKLAETRELTQPEQNRLKLALAGLDDRKIQLSDLGDKVQVVIDGVPGVTMLKSESPDAKLRAASSKAATDQLNGIYDAQDAIALATEAKSLIGGSTGSLLGAARDSIYAAFGVSTPEAAQLAQLKVLAGNLLSKFERLPGPVSDFEMKAYQEANGNLASATTPNATKLAAVEAMLRLYKAREARGQQRAGARPGAAPGAPKATKRFNPATGQLEAI